MLFNLSSQIHYKNQGKFAIDSRSLSGPIFKGDDNYWDLGVEDPFNGERKGVSIAHRAGYNIGREEDFTNMLSKKEDGYFTIT
jgi:hypothetical protein